MAYPFTHAFAGAAVGLALAPHESRWKFAAAAGIAAILPDFDVLSYRLGIPYSSMFSHRAVTHSFTFALAVSIVVVLTSFRSIPAFRSRKYLLILSFFAATATHPIIDSLTDGGAGVAFFAPFSQHRYFLPWRPIHVASLQAIIELRASGIRAVFSEMKYVYLPVLLAVGCIMLIRYALFSRSKRTSTN